MAINYLNNKDMLAEIHKSKSTYCSFLTDEDKDFHIILPSVDKINIRSIAEGKRNKAKTQRVKEASQRSRKSKTTCKRLENQRRISKSKKRKTNGKR